jgi:hypothetical protein
MHLNTYITHEGQRYEIYWTTPAAAHVMRNYISDQFSGVHKDIDHGAVSQLLRRARFIVPLPEDPRPHLHVCLTGRAEKVYETYVYLVPELDHRPARCVVMTCYMTNKQQYRQLFDKPLI